MSNHHPRRYLRDPYDGKRVAVDRDLADIIAECWRLDIETVSCCQNAGESLADMPERYPHMADYVKARLGRAYVDFATTEDAAWLLTLLGNHGPRDAFYRRTFLWYEPDAWTTSVSIMDTSNFEPMDDEPVDFQPYMVQIHFPVTDIPEIVTRLRRVKAD